MEQTAMYVNIMQQSLERKYDYLKEILDITKEQSELIKNDSLEDDVFEATLDRKEILINNINEIDKGFTAVYDKVRGEVLEDRQLYRNQLLKIQELIKKCVDLGMEIEALEERNRAGIERKLSMGFKGVKQAKQSKSVASKYYQSMANGYVNDSLLYDRKK